MRKTKIIATVGPATASYEALKSILAAGVNIVRFNFSHANYEGTKAILANIEKLRGEGFEVATLLDTKGPEIRTGDLAEKRQYNAGDKIRMFCGDASKVPADADALFCDYEYLAEDMGIGSVIRIDSGLLDVVVEEKHADYVLVRCLNSCLIGSRRHINLPGVRLRLPGVTDKDRGDLQFAVEQNMDYIAASFIRSAANVAEIRAITGDIKIISKIENEEGVENLGEILEASDGIMVARGDLGIEVAIEDMPVLQRDMVKLARSKGKVVVVATHMLESMIENPFPTRAEVSDIFNAVMQKTDCTMLSGETAQGKYPCASVEMMAKVIVSAEKQRDYSEHPEFEVAGLSSEYAAKKELVRSAIETFDRLKADALLVFSTHGTVARFAGAYRPGKMVHVIVPSEKVVRSLAANFAIYARVLDGWKGEYDEKLVSRAVLEAGIEKGKRVVVVMDIESNNHAIPTIQVVTA